VLGDSTEEDSAGEDDDNDDEGEELDSGEAAEEVEPVPKEPGAVGTTLSNCTCALHEVIQTLPWSEDLQESNE